ncbi:MAG TPA: NAD(P)-dependent oxidoreductase [Candidatus Dormibacteraeota bacterium]|nr:NAD(P)-dependent oxidoreductase [Candidatus Dormibacteraeota bacterium]
MKIAFFGAGNMGEPMALNLMRAGHEITVFNRTPAKAAALENAGAKVAKAPAEALQEAEVAITMLADDQALRDTLLASDAIRALPRGAIHMGCSTISVALSKQLEREHARRGQGYVAAPVLGRPDAAAEKKLWVLAAGPREQVERCRPLMEAIGRGISVVGEQPWQANVTKIAANFMIASVLETLGEAFALVRKSGMDPHAFLAVMNPFFNSPIYTNYGRIIADGQFEPAGFRLQLGLKDVNMALAAAQDAASPLPLASLIRDHLLSAIAHGREDADWSALTEVIARNAGLEGQ